MERVDEWEASAINKIRKTAQECRQLLDQHKNKHILNMEEKVNYIYWRIETNSRR